MKTNKRIVSFLIAIMMLVAILPTTAFAADYYLTVENPDGATITTSTGSQGVEEGTIISVNVTVTDSTKELDRILVNGSEILGNTFHMPMRNTTVTAVLKSKVVDSSYNSITVVGGTASQSKQKVGELVSITATESAGKTFKEWTSTDGVIFADKTKSSTTFTMPNKDVTVTAVYTSTPIVTPKTYSISMINGSASHNYQEAGKSVSVTAHLISGKTFKEWTSTDGVVFADKTKTSTTFTMPNKDVTITATYVKSESTSRPVIDSINLYTDRVTGYATPGSEVRLYKDGKYVSNKYVTASSTGYFTIYYDFYNYNSNNFYNMSLIANKDGLSSAEYYLYNYNGTWNNGGYWYNGQWYANDYSNKYPIISLGSLGDTTITGYNVYSDDLVTVRDSLGRYLGSANADTRGEFKVYLNRALVQGEKLTVTASNKNYKDRATSYLVPGSYYPSTLYSQFTIGSKSYTRNVKGVTVTSTMDVAPFLQNGRTMLPLRYVAESLSYDVSWNDATRIATFTNGSNVVRVSIDTPVFTVNGVEHRFSTTPITVNGRIMLPVSEVAMALGLTHSDNVGSNANIVWDPKLQTVTIKK